MSLSLSTAAAEETKRKMYSSVLLIGGGFMFNGAAIALQSRLQAKLPASHRKLVDQVEVIARPKVCEITVHFCQIFLEALIKFPTFITQSENNTSTREYSEF